jgi:hypothetical protein
MSTTSRKGNTLSLDFHGPSRVHRTRQKRRALPAAEPFRQLNCFQGIRLLKRKDNSSQDSRRRLQVHERCREGPTTLVPEY